MRATKTRQKSNNCVLDSDLTNAKNNRLANQTTTATPSLRLWGSGWGVGGGEGVGVCEEAEGGLLYLVAPVPRVCVGGWVPAELKSGVISWVSSVLMAFLWPRTPTTQCISTAFGAATLNGFAVRDTGYSLLLSFAIYTAQNFNVRRTLSL